MPDANKWGKLADSFIDVKTLIGVGSLGIAGTSLALNKRNIYESEKSRATYAKELKQNREQNKKLLETLDKLNNNLERKKLINYNYYIPESAKAEEKVKEMPVEKPAKRRKFLGLFSTKGNSYNNYLQKNYSIESGRYSGEKNYDFWEHGGNKNTKELKKTVGIATRIAGSVAGRLRSGGWVGAINGYLIGLLLSDLFTCLLALAEKSAFNTSKSNCLKPKDLTKIVEDLYSDSNSDPVGKIYDIDKPAQNYTVSILSKGSVFAMLIYRPSRNELRQLNKILDEYCAKYKNADYASENVEGKENSYLVELNVIKGTEKSFIKSLISTGIKFNIITENFDFRKASLSQKSYSFGTDFLDNSFKGASIGGALGSVAAPFFVRAKDGTNPTNYEWTKGAAKGGMTGIIVGAALGTLFGIIKNEATSRNRDNTINNRYLPKVVDLLVKSGFWVDKDFTRDPKVADNLKTRICIMVSRYSSDTRISINCSSDFKTQELIDKMINELGLSKRVAIKKQGSERFVNIEMIKRTRTDEDINMVKSISEYFIRKHIPIYLVEVG